ncbi:serine palmitoyltransferase 2-like [Brevipalpus obovatus]|uniref:serine palmitoyltransferase 2-like n=1 Tax=Brevipalpus obovatus TaxID=246614 RepID=UPI003D9E42B3
MADNLGVDPCEEFEETPLIVAIFCYISYMILGIFGHLRDFLRETGIEKSPRTVERNRKGYVPLYRGYENFFNRNIYRRIRDICCQPVIGVPGATIDLLDRASDDYNQTFRVLDRSAHCINMGSYNYLGFAEITGPRVGRVHDCISKYGSSVGTTRHEYGTMDIHNELEKLMAEFLGVEDSVVFGMGFATNTTNIPTLAGKGCLLISDKLNHVSLILGCKLAGSTKKVFKHNDMRDLEQKLVEALADGQLPTHKPWEKIIILVEGVYSMEGSIVNLPEVVRLKKKYKAYLYVDEAHSIGALGKSGRGVCDHFGIQASEIDLLMGTFTKSYGSAGGYVAGKKELINHIRVNSHSFAYASSMAAPLAQQIILVLRTLMGQDSGSEGKDRIARLAQNSKYFRQKLKQMGFIVYGNNDSPVVPLLIFHPGKIREFALLAKKLGLAVIVVGFPATPLVEVRVRFCLSASHTKEMLDKTLEVIDYIGDKLWLKYSREARKPKRHKFSKNLINTDLGRT